MLSKSPIIPSVLTSKAEVFGERLNLAAKSTRSVHLDVIDGEFCDGRSLAIEDWPALKFDYSEAHLMVKEPLNYLESLAAKKVTRAIVHIESNFEPFELARAAKALDLLLGWAINPDTDLDRLRPLYDISSYIQVMGVQPGQSGQKMISYTPLAVSYLRRIPSRRLTISVDGGVAEPTIGALYSAGAQYFVVSHALFNTTDYQAALAGLLEAIKEPAIGASNDN